MITTPLFSIISHFIFLVHQIYYISDNIMCTYITNLIYQKKLNDLYIIGTESTY